MPRIEISEQILKRLQEHAEPLVDSPDSVIRKILDAYEDGVEGSDPPQTTGPNRAPRGEKTPNEAFYGPLVKVLREAGGELRAQEAVERVGDLMADELNEIDRAPLKTGELRWKNTVRWARNDLVSEGTLDSDSPHGIWRLADND